MLIQVIHCHPLTDSYNHALFQTITTALEDKGHCVAATDLYREQFDPIMSVDERRSYYAPRYDDTMVSAHTALLRRVDADADDRRRSQAAWRQDRNYRRAPPVGARQ
jgi:putative NADPH-quinone reductase